MKKIGLYISLLFILVSCSGTSKTPVDYVDPFIGTGFHGHTYPGATTPYGAVQLSPDTRRGNWDACSGYHYSDSTILGFSHTHLSGTGCIDLGDILFYPTTKQINPNKEGVYLLPPIRFSHTDEQASPGYYSVYFKEEGIKAELTASRYTGVHRYTYKEGEKQYLAIDMSHLLTEETIDSVWISKTGNNEITGMRRTQGWTPNQCIFFVAKFSHDFLNVSFANQQLMIDFGTSNRTPIIARVALSIVSAENAIANLQADNAHENIFDFDDAHQKARREWSEALSDITITGGTESDRINFYTAQYHTKIVPNIVSDANGQDRYSTFSIWDTYRAWNPLQTLVNHQLVTDMINSYLDIYDTTGELPIWPLSAGETRTMIGYHSVSVIADAFLKGIRGFDVEKAFEAMKVSSDINKKGSDYYIQYGFIPSNIKRESVSCLLEYAYDDWCIAQMARGLGRESDYEKYSNRALNYVNVFDGHTRFFRGKRMDGNWETPFNPFAPGRAYTEATAWQYRFYVPHDVNGMIQLFGSKESFISQLDSLFIVDPVIDGDMADITGLIGQYAHGNEPSHHMAYLYNYVGQPWKSQQMTRRILSEMYTPTPEGIIGNEDCGQMSAWYIFTSLGFYPVCPGSNEFILTTPLFNKATMKLANGKTLTIQANNANTHTYIEKVTLNGEDIKTNYITYEQIMNGGTLTYSLSATPNYKRGITEEEQPYSLTTGLVTSVPYTTTDLDLFIDKAIVDLHTTTPDAVIYYTTNGTEPDETSTLYTKSFEITVDTPIRAVAFKEGYQPSRTFAIAATKAIYANPVRTKGVLNGTHYRYYEGKYTSVNDIEKSPLVAQGIIPSPTISIAKQDDHYGFVFSGVIQVPCDGVYEFLTRSDDGSVLYINNSKVVDNDGSHAAIEATGRIALKKGFHTFTLLYFEDYEGEHLSWEWKKPQSTIFESIPDEVLFIR